MGEKSCETCYWFNSVGEDCDAPLSVECDEKTLTGWKPRSEVEKPEKRPWRWHEEKVEVEKK